MKNILILIILFSLNVMADSDLLQKGCNQILSNNKDIKIESTYTYGYITGSIQTLQMSYQIRKNIYLKTVRHDVICKGAKSGYEYSSKKGIKTGFREAIMHSINLNLAEINNIKTVY